VLSACWWHDKEEKPFALLPNGIVHRHKPRFVIPIDGKAMLECANDLSDQERIEYFKRLEHQSAENVQWLDTPTVADEKWLMDQYNCMFISWMLTIECMDKAIGDAFETFREFVKARTCQPT